MVMIAIAGVIHVEAFNWKIENMNSAAIAFN